MAGEVKLALAGQGLDTVIRFIETAGLLVQ
jgi:hypothetical protein